MGLYGLKYGGRVCRTDRATYQPCQVKRGYWSGLKLKESKIEHEFKASTELLGYFFLRVAFSLRNSE